MTFVPRPPDGKQEACRDAEQRMVVAQAQEVITVTLPFTPTQLALDPELHLLAELRPPAQVDALQPCAP